jgi:hypothetical protein
VSRLLLFALVTAGPPLVYGLALVIRSRVQQQRAARQAAWHRGDKVSVEALKARIERERVAEAERTDRSTHRHPGLPAGWVWPDRDEDAAPARPARPKPRPYLRTAHVGLRGNWPTRVLPEIDEEGMNGV